MFLRSSNFFLNSFSKLNKKNSKIFIILSMNILPPHPPPALKTIAIHNHSSLPRGSGGYRCYWGQTDDVIKISQHSQPTCSIDNKIQEYQATVQGHHGQAKAAIAFFKKRCPGQLAIVARRQLVIMVFKQLGTVTLVQEAIMILREVSSIDIGYLAIVVLQ